MFFLDHEFENKIEIESWKLHEYIHLDLHYHGVWSKAMRIINIIEMREALEKYKSNVKKL